MSWRRTFPAVPQPNATSPAIEVIRGHYSMDSRRIVVTGMGLVSPLGSDLEVVWQRLLAGRSGLRNLPEATVADLPTRVGGAVPTLEEDAEAGFDPDRATPP